MNFMYPEEAKLQAWRLKTPLLSRAVLLTPCNVQRCAKN